MLNLIAWLLEAIGVLLGVIVVIILSAIAIIIGVLLILGVVVFFSKVTGKENSITKFWDDMCT